MLQRLWKLAKRYPGRALFVGGLAILIAVTIHYQLVKAARLSGRQPLTTELTLTALDMALSLVGFVMTMWGAWRMARNLP